MRKIISIAISTIILFSVSFISGCSDFEFNPLGKWTLIDDVVYHNNVEYSRDDINTNIFVLEYIFEKSGTGYILVDNTPIDSDFTYKYNNETLNITFVKTGTSLEYKISDDRTQMVNTTENEYINENGETVNVREIQTLSKN